MLGGFHGFDNATETRIATNPFDKNFQSPCLVDGAGIDLTANIFACGHGFAGERGLVDEQILGGDQPHIGGDHIAGGKTNNVAGNKLLNAGLDKAVIDVARLSKPVTVFGEIALEKHGRRERFERQKFVAGLLKACEKRPVRVSALEAVADKVEAALQEKPDREMSTEEIGAHVMQELKALDKVAYVRFASVYRNFRDIDEFRNELNDLLKAKD